jgi:hypothetical protein
VTNNSKLKTQNSKLAVTLAVVRQDQMTAFAVVTGAGEDRSLLLHPAFPAALPRPRPGDLVAVVDDQVIYAWQRALVLRVLPAGLRLRLPGGDQVIAPPLPTLPDPDTLRAGEPVFATPTAAVARAWPWYEPQPASSALQAYATGVVEGMRRET